MGWKGPKLAHYLQSIVVLPALSNPSTSILASLSPNKLTSLDSHKPIPSRAKAQLAYVCPAAESWVLNMVWEDLHARAALLHWIGDTI